MRASSADIPVKRPGRKKTTGRGEGLLVRLQAEPLSRLDGWIAEQPDPKPSRPEAIRRMLAMVLETTA